MENISVKSVMLYIAKKYRFVCIAMLAGMVLLSGLNVKKGQTYVENVTDTDTATKEDLEKAQDKVENAQENLKASEKKLEGQKELLESYEESWEKYQEKWDEDVYIQTSAENRHAVSTVYQFSSAKDVGQLRQALNALKTALGSIQEELASEVTSENLSSYNAEKMFTSNVNLDQYQVNIKTSSETEEGLNELITFYHAWMEKKLAKYQEDYPNAEITMKVIEENQYTYYDSDIFSQQTAASDKKISLQNSILSMKNAIVSTENEILSNKEKVSDAKTELKKIEKLWNNTVEISEESEKVISKSSIIIYLIAGAVLGFAACSVILAFIYMYGTKLHDSQDLECKIGEKTIGTLYSPVYKGKSTIIRKLDQWSGIQEIQDMGLQYQRIATDIALMMKHLGKERLVLTGTVEPAELEAIRTELVKYLENIEICAGENPVHDVATSRMLMEVEVAVIVEKIGSSRISEIRRLKEYLDHCGIRILGGITE